MHRFDRLRNILELDAERDCAEIYRLLSQYEFPWDIKRSLELALFRTYAVPAIGRLLDATGEFTRCPQKRYDDTALVLYEILQSEVDSDRRRIALDQLNGIHGRYRISNADFVYTLATFVVLPVRWIENFGWRRLHPHEVRALTNAMRQMGEGMHLDDIPGTYEEFEHLLDSYERKRFAFDSGGRRVADATMNLFGSWFPSPLAGSVGRATRLLMEPHLLDAFALEHPPPVMRAMARLALKLRGSLIRLGPPRPDSRPVLPNAPTYPHGYEITELGPESFHRSRHPARSNS